ncbi:MAG: hypothetical protein AAGD96_08915 [Chloroflexota bacterium]
MGSFRWGTVRAQLGTGYPMQRFMLRSAAYIILNTNTLADRATLHANYASHQTEILHGTIEQKRKNEYSKN